MDNKDLEKEIFGDEALCESKEEITPEETEALDCDAQTDSSEDITEHVDPALFKCEDDILNEAYDAAAPIIEQDNTLNHAPTSVYDGPLSHMGEEDEGNSPRKKSFIAVPVLIAAIAFLITGALVFGAIGIYNLVFDNGIVDVWEVKDADNNAYFIFEKDGTVRLDRGSAAWYGSYDVATYNMDADNQELPKIVTDMKAVKELNGEVNVLKTTFNEFGLYGGEYVYTIEYINDVKTLSLDFVSNGSVQSIVFTKSSLPEFKLDPNNITNASADEAGVTELNVDSAMIGSWSEPDYGTYTFNSDGTGNYYTKCQDDPTYLMYYGVSVSYGIDFDFKYTVANDKIYITFALYTGEESHETMTYKVDGSTIIINGVGYTKN